MKDELSEEEVITSDQFVEVTYNFLLFPIFQGVKTFQAKRYETRRTTKQLMEVMPYAETQQAPILHELFNSVVDFPNNEETYLRMQISSENNAELRPQDMEISSALEEFSLYCKEEEVEDLSKKRKIEEEEGNYSNKMC
jgi:hypothetical protein